MKKKLDGNCTRILRAVLNKSWRQHPKKQQLDSHQLSISKTILIRWTRHVGLSWRSKNKLISDVLQWTPSYGRASVGDLLEFIYNNSVLIQDVAWKTSWEWWTIETRSERGSGKSVLAARHDDDDDDDICYKIQSHPMLIFSANKLSIMMIVSITIRIKKKIYIYQRFQSWELMNLLIFLWWQILKIRNGVI